jgi:CBS domain-containing protein
MSRHDTDFEGIYRHLGSAYCQTLHGQGRLGVDPFPSRRAWHRLQVRDVMTADVAAVDLTASYKQVAWVLAERCVTALPVLDQAGHVRGVVSEADLLCKQERGHRTPAGSTRLRTRGDRAKAAAHTAAELMTTPPVTIHPDARLGAAAQLMNDRHIKRLPVVDSSGTLIGIVSRRDLLSVFLRPDVDIAADVHAIVVGVLPDDSSAVSVSVSDGVVTLAGSLGQPGHAAAAIRLASEVDGVVDVIDNLSAQVAYV